jgi:hypothetical protein
MRILLQVRMPHKEFNPNVANFGHAMAPEPPTYARSGLRLVTRRTQLEVHSCSPHRVGATVASCLAERHASPSIYATLGLTPPCGTARWDRR